MNITHNEMQFVLLIFKSPEIEYNANSIAKKLGISAMGALKIAKRVEKENIITCKTKGKAKFYKLNLGSEYTKQYIKFLLKTDNKKFQKLRKEIEEINSINIKKIHPMYQTKEDVKNNIKKEDKPLLNALKGIVVFGEDTLMGVLNESI